MDDYITPEQVAERLQISMLTVKRWLRSGKLPAHKIGRLWRISEQELDAWIKSVKE